MKRITFAPLFALVALAFAACDDGRIYNEEKFNTEGRVAKLTGTLVGMENWPSGYSIAIAGFKDGDDYAVISRALTEVDGNVTVLMTNISDDVTNIQLCVLDRLRRCVTTFYEAETDGIRDTVRIEVGTLDVSMLAAIQTGYFSTTCANCHGASNRAAAGLYLTEGRSYGSLVNMPSAKVEGHKLVEPGNAENSVLHMVLNRQSVEGISMDHRDLVSEKNEQSILPLIDTWINNGAPEQ